MADEIIGGVAISVTGDYSDLEAAFQEALAQAQSDGDKLAAAIQNSVGTPDVSGITGAFEQVSESATQTGQSVANALDIQIAAPDVSAVVQSFASLGESATAAAGAITDGFSGVGAAIGAGVAPVDDFYSALSKLTDAGASIDEAFQQLTGDTQTFMDAISSGSLNELVDNFGKVQTEAQGAAAGLTAVSTAAGEVTGAYSTGAASADTLATAEKDLGTAATTAAPAIRETGEAAKEASSGFGDLATQLLALGGISLTIDALVELGKAAVEASDKLDDAAYAIGRFNQGAMSGKEEIAGLLAVAQDEGLSFPGLVTAAQHMEALGIHGQDAIDTLRELGNASELTGGSIDSMAQKFATLAEGSSISAMSLKRLGLTVDEIKETMIDMGANVDQVNSHWQQLWKVMDETQHAAVLQGALENLDGAAKAMNDDIKGDVQRTMNDFYVTMGKLGDVIAPLAQQALPYLVDAIKVLVTAVDAGVTSFKILIDVVVAYAKALGTAYAAVAEAAADVQKADFSGAANAITGAFTKIKDTIGGLKDQIAADFKAGADFAEQVWNVSIPASVASGASKVKVSLDGVALAHKDLASSVQASFEQIAAFEDKLSNGGSVSQLQAAFENASKAINTVAKVDLPAAIQAVDDYTAAQIRNGAGASVIMQAFQEFSKLVGQLAKIDLPAASAAMTDYLGKLIAAKEPIGIIQAALEQEEKMLQQLAKQDLQAAADGWDKLIQKLRDTNAPVQILNQALQDHMKFLDGVSAAADKAATAMGKAAVAFSDFNTKGAPATQIFKDAATALENLGIMAAKAPQPISDLNRAMIDAGASTAKAKNAFEDLHTPIDKIITDMGRLTQAATASGDWSPVLTALDSFDKRIQELSKTDLPEAAKQMEAFIQGMINAGAPIDLIQGQLSKLQTIVQKMTSEGLPGASDAWKKYIDLLKQVPSAIKDIQQADAQNIQQQQTILEAMQKRGDAYGYILEQQGKVLQAEIDYAAKSGADATDLVLGLEKVRLKQQDLKESTQGLGQTYVSVIGDVMKGFDQIAGAMADAIVNAKSLGDALIGVFKQIAQAILKDLIAGALQPLEGALRKMIEGTLPDFKAAGDVAKKGIDDLSKAADDASVGIKGIGSSATSAASQLSSFASTLSIITGIISAGAAVAGDIILAHISSDTGHIEVNTRSCLAELENARADAWSQHNQMYDRAGEIKNRLDTIYDKLSNLQITSSGGALTDAEGKALESVGDAAPFMLSELKAIDASTQYINGRVDTLHNDLTTWFPDIHDALYMINGTILTLISAVNYGSQSGKSYASQSMEASAGLEDTIESVGAQSHAQLSKIDGSIQDGTGRGAAVAGAELSLLQQQLAQQQLAAQQLLTLGQAQYAGASSIAGQILGLQHQVQADSELEQLAVQQGDLALAAKYHQDSVNVQGILLPLLSSSQTINSSVNAVDTSIRNGSTDVAMSATNAGVLVSTAVGQSAVTISNAVINSAAASASLFNTGISSLTSIIGAFGKVGGGLPGGQTGLPSGSGLGNTNPNGTATYTNPGIPVGEQPGFNPNAPSTGGMTQAQWQATGHNSPAPNWWLNGTPQPGINQSNVPHFLTGGTVAVGGLAVVDKNEIVIPEDQAIAVKSGEAVISSPHLVSDGGSSTIFTQPNKVDLSSADKDFVDHGPSVADDGWQKLADQVKGVGDAIAAQDKARASVADEMMMYQAEMSHAQELLAAATQAGDKSKIALAQQYVSMMQRLIDSTLPSGPKDKTPVQDPNFQPATSEQAKQIAVLQQAANDAQAQLIAANKSGDTAKIQAAQQQVSIALSALSAAQAQQKSSDRIVEIQQSIAQYQAALMVAQQSGDSTKIALAQQQLTMEQQLLVSAMAQQQSAATSAAVAPLPGIEITKVGQQLSLQLTAINLQLISAQSSLSETFQSGDSQKIALAQQQVDIIKQLLAAVMAQGDGATQQQGPSQADLLASSMAWLDAQQGLTADQKAISAATYQSDADAGLLPTPKSSGSDFSGYNPYSTPTSSAPKQATPSGPANKTPIQDPNFEQPYGPANKTPVQDMPTFDTGGFVGADTMAMLHHNEWVVPEDVTGMLRRMASAPQMVGVQQAQGANVSQSSSDTYQFIIQAGNRDGQALLREISSAVKTRTGRTAKFSN